MQKTPLAGYPLPPGFNPYRDLAVKLVEKVKQPSLGNKHTGDKRPLRSTYNNST